MSSTYNYALGGIVIGLVVLGAVTLVVHRCIERRVRRMGGDGEPSGYQESGYQAQPWMAPGHRNAASLEMGSLRKQGSVTATAPPPYS